MRQTIYVTLMGGLANQACQYAAAIKLAKPNIARVVCDLSFLNAHQDPNSGITPRQFTLNTLLLHPAETVDETPAGVTPLSGEVDSVPNDGKDYRIQGYFQRLSALPDFWELRHIFMLPTSVGNNPIGHLLGAMDKYEHNIGIHIRRSDYLNPNALAFHGVLGVEYYQEAISLLMSRNVLQKDDTQLVVYSDDTIWCSTELVPKLGLDNVIYAEDYVDGDAAQLYSMAFQPYFAIANSSFSWLGRLRAMSYNNTNTVFPKRWFRDYSPPGMMPSSWVGV